MKHVVVSILRDNKQKLGDTQNDLSSLTIDKNVGFPKESFVAKPPSLCCTGEKRERDMRATYTKRKTNQL